MSELYEQMTDDGNDKLCENMDCERFPPDWDPEEDTEETYQQGQWKKCCLCDGYFDDDGLGDILFVQEEPNNQEASCDLCGKENNIVQMKGSGQYLCENACDEESDEEEEEEEESEDEVDKEKIVNCDFCCEDKSFETYYTVRRGRQIYFSCNDCWENRETQIVAYSAYTWEKSVFPGPAFFTISKDEETNKCDNCNIELDRIRDGSIDNSIRCNNCYWEDKEGKNSINVIKPDYRENKIIKEESYSCFGNNLSENEEESICLFNYYICRYCDYITTNDDPDCKKCKNELCMELFQAENQSSAMCKKKQK